MNHIPEQDFGVLFPTLHLGTDLFISEIGFEKCKPTKPTEYIPTDDYVLHLCMQGEGFLRLKQEEIYHIGAGDLFVIPAKTANTYYPLATNPWIYRWVGIQGNLAKELLTDCGLTSNHYILRGAGDDQIAYILTNIYTALEEQRELKAMSHLFILLDALTQKNDAIYKKKLTPGEEYFHHLTTYIQQHYSTDFTINDLANECNIDRTYIFKLFKRFVQISPQLYILHYRLEKASTLLRRSTLSITDISFVVGFRSTSYFSRQFSNHFSLSPRAYRRMFTKSH